MKRSVSSVIKFDSVEQRMKLIAISRANFKSSVSKFLVEYFKLDDDGYLDFITPKKESSIRRKVKLAA